MNELMRPPRSGRLLRYVALLLLAAYVLFVLWVVLRSSPDLGSEVAYRVWQATAVLGAPPWWQSFVRAEFVANIGMLVPLSFLGSMAWPRLTWRDWTAGVFLFSFGAEFIQAAMLATRSATYSDVVANTLGGFIGGVLGAVVVWLLGLRGSSQRSSTV